MPAGTFTVTITGTGILPGATVFQGSVQLSTVGTPTASSITATGWMAASASTPFCVKNPGYHCSNTVTVPVTSSNSGGGTSSGGSS